MLRALLLYLCLQIVVGQLLAQSHGAAYSDEMVVVRLKPESVNARVEGNFIRPTDFTTLPNITSFEPLTNQVLPNSRVKESIYLSNIFFLEVDNPSAIPATIAQLQKYDNVLYAEPVFEMQLLQVPNDPAAQRTGGNQSYLNSINAHRAWEVFTGTRKMVIGSLDTGIQPDHEDLAANLFQNEGDPINGIDDDRNGYVDDQHGWDMADNDNSPRSDRSQHGNIVAGVHSAVGNNGKGMAGVAFNSRILPVKIFRSQDNRSSRAYQGVIYAADMGVNVMNLSWGAPGAYSRFNQDVINYAALERDVVIVAAAGNTPAELNFYPASYENVISVGSSDLTGNKAGYATFSYFIDLLAPGVSIYSTANGNGYTSETGSSFAAPQVAGAAALVRERFPQYNAVQVAEQLRVTATQGAQLPANAPFEGRIGSGMLNVHNAITNTSARSVRMKDINIKGIFGTNLFYDDTLRITGLFKNHLNPVQNLRITLTSNSPNIKFLNSSLLIPSMTTNGEYIVNGDDFKFLLEGNDLQKDRVVIKISYNGLNYSDLQYISFDVNTKFVNVIGGKTNLTVSRDGDLGFYEGNASRESGYYVNEEIIATSFGLMVGESETALATNAINDLNMLTRDRDFVSLENIRFLRNSIADFYIESEYRDSTNATGLIIEQKSIGWNDLDAIITEFRVINPTNENKQNQHLGIFSDFNLGNPENNRTGYDIGRKLGYTYATDGAQYAGLALLSPLSALFSGIDLGTANGNTVDIDSIFTKKQKADLLLGRVDKRIAGAKGVGNDVAQMLSASVGNLASGQTRKVAFVFTAAPTLTSMQQIVDEAARRYQQFLLSPPILLTDSVCIGQSATITITGGQRFDFYGTPQLTNLLHSGNNFQTPPLSSNTTYYVVNRDKAYPGDVRRVNVVIENPKASFSIPADTLFITDGGIVRLQPQNNSIGTRSYNWDFGNGVFSNKEQPEVVFQKEGRFDIKLIAKSRSGCASSYNKTLHIVARNTIPSSQTIRFCKGDSVNIAPVEFTNYKLYSVESQPKLIYAGSNFTFTSLLTDTAVYITNNDNGKESLPVMWHIVPYPLENAFNIVHDTTDLSSNKKLMAIDQSIGAQSYHWTINGETFNEKNPVFLWDGTSDIDVKQTITNADFGCSLTLSQRITPAVSSKPLSLDTAVCTNTPIVIKPDGGTSFIFYGNASRTQVIGKGSQLRLEALDSPRAIWVTNTDKIGESDAAMINIEVIQFKDSIGVSPEFLILAEGRSVQFFALNDETKSWQWSIAGQPLETIRNPVLFFDSAGVYSVKLIATNALGCEHAATLNYKVFNVTRTTQIGGNDMQVYPVPFAEALHIESSKKIRKIALFDLSGKLILSQIVEAPKSTLNTASVKKGMYLLVIYSQTGEVNTYSIIK